MESSHQRSISSSTCSSEKLSRSNCDVAGVGLKDRDKKGAIWLLNLFLRERRERIERISRGEMSGKVKNLDSIITSASSQYTGSHRMHLNIFLYTKEIKWEVLLANLLGLRCSFPCMDHLAFLFDISYCYLIKPLTQQLL